MWWLLTACDEGSPPIGVETADTGVDSMPPGWTALQLTHTPVVEFVTDGTTSWVIGGVGAVIEAPEDGPWVDLGVAPFTERGVHDADAVDGIVWAVGDEELASFDGAAWSVVPLPEALHGAIAVAARADGTVAVLAGDEPTVDCYTGPCDPVVTTTLGLWDGAAWSLHTHGPDDWLNDLVEADGALVAVGGRGWVARWDDGLSAWVDAHRGEQGSLRAVAVDGDGVVAVGDGGLVVRGEIGALQVRSGGGVDGLDRVAVGADGSAWALSWRSAWVDDGTGWVEVALPEDNAWHEIGARSDGSAVVLGDQGGPTALAGGTSGWTVAWHEPSIWGVESLWVDVDGTTWLGGGGAIGRWDASGAFEAWTPPSPQNESAGAIRAIAGRGPDDVVAGGDHGVFDWDGATWRWSWVAEDAIVWDVAVAPDGAAFAGAGAWLPDETQLAQLLRRDAGGWVIDPAPIPGGSRALMSLIAFAADDVYALTWQPSALLHFDGASWADLTGDLGGFYNSVWGRSGTDLYLTSDDGVDPLLHWDGAALTAVAGAPPNLSGVSGTDDAVIVAGTDGFGDAFAPYTAILRDGVWTEMYRASGRMAVGGGGETVAVTGDGEAWRGPAATWAR